MEITINKMSDWNRLPDWQQRFVLEYTELLERSIKLAKMLNNWDNLNFTPKERAAIEGVEFIKLVTQKALKLY